MEEEELKKAESETASAPAPAEEQTTVEEEKEGSLNDVKENSSTPVSERMYSLSLLFYM